MPELDSEGVKEVELDRFDLAAGLDALIPGERVLDRDVLEALDLADAALADAPKDNRGPLVPTWRRDRARVICKERTCGAASLRGEMIWRGPSRDGSALTMRATLIVCAMPCMMTATVN